MSEWQPIETAPRDGTAILVCAQSDHDEWNFMAVFWCIPDCHQRGWAVISHGFREFSCFVSPTHWMPLPAAPEAPNE